MQLLQINPTKNRTIHLLFQKQFPAIKSSDDKLTYYVTPKTISYIHGLVTDSITCLPSDACNQRALRNEIMILEVLEKNQEPAVFRQKLFNTLTHYYEEIQSMSCACGRPKPKSFKRTMRVEADAGGAESHEAALAAAEEVVEDNVPPPQLPTGVDSDAPAIPVTHPAKKSGKGRAGSGGAKPPLQ
jgi:hypothetical protein